MDDSRALRRPTLAQVALIAGVSRSTASYALNGRKPVSPETRERVRAAAARIGYRINTNARSLRTQTTARIGVVLLAPETAMVATHDALFWPRFQSGFVLACSEAGCVVTYAGHDRTQELIDSGIELLAFQGVGGPDVLAGIDLPFGLPVLAMLPLAGHRNTVVGHDAESIAREVVGHVVDQGAHMLGWLPVATVTATLGHWRRALARECERRGIGFCDGVVADDLSNIDAEVGRLRGAGVDAIFAVPGSTPRLVTAIRDAGLAIPEDMLLVTQAEGLVEQTLSPQVSTLSLCAWDSARSAAEAALDLLRSGSVSTVQMPFELHVRASSRRR